MNILDKITALRLERHWTEYQLAEHSGLTQSTISSWYRKNMLPTIPSLTKICDAFGISMSEFFLEDKDNAIYINEKQKLLLEYAARLNSNQYTALLEFLKQI